MTRRTTSNPATSHPLTAAQVRRALRKVTSPTRAIAATRFFKTGEGEYGHGDQFIGVTVPEQRHIARQFASLPLEEADKLLTSPIHEERLTALLILCDRFNNAHHSDRTKLRARIFRLYMKRLRFINNWDLVDASAEHIVGGWLADKPRDLLDKLATSPHLWSRRIAVLATFHYIKQYDATDALRICHCLVNDPHDLIHKATGWMLREVGKRVSVSTLRAFLRAHAAHMPRTMLRYAIERLPPVERSHWLNVKPRRSAAESGFESSLPGVQNDMSKTTTTARMRPDGKVVKVSKDGRETPFAPAAMRAMTPRQVEAAASSDPTARPMTPEQLREARRVPRVKTLRRALGFTQEEFSVRYHIPLGTLRDWEQGRTEPDQPARAYLKVIASDPERVRRILDPKAD